MGRAVDALLRGQVPSLSSGKWLRMDAFFGVEPSRCLPRPCASFLGAGSASRSRDPPQVNPLEWRCPSASKGRSLRHRKCSQVLCCGLSEQRLDEAVRRHDWAVQAVDDLLQADVVLSVRQGLGRQPETASSSERRRRPDLGDQIGHPSSSGEGFGASVDAP